MLAFKRSLAAGILDGGTGEISLGGSRLNRFMKDVENVTGHMGEGEVMAAAEEAGNVAAASGAEPTEAMDTEDKADAVVRGTGCRGRRVRSGQRRSLGRAVTVRLTVSHRADGNR